MNSTIWDAPGMGRWIESANLRLPLGGTRKSHEHHRFGGKEVPKTEICLVSICLDPMRDRTGNSRTNAKLIKKLSYPRSFSSTDYHVKSKPRASAAQGADLSFFAILVES